jgi:4-hydroxy-tetrahydrodipicolinate reductase
MKIALLGYGAMGKQVAQLAAPSGDEVGAILTSHIAVQGAEEIAQLLSNHDVAIDFSVGAAVLEHVEACGLARVPLVEGTTGWNDRIEEVRRVVSKHDSALVYGANFSLGVNLFYRIVAHAASLFSAVEGYEPFIEEAHHARKKDAPSGTALKLREMLISELNRAVSVSSTRAGFIPGKHVVGFDSAADQITLEHTARSREGFAAGALLAGHWIDGRKGIYEFTEVVDEIVHSARSGRT